MNIRQAQLPNGWEIRKLGEVCEIKPPKREAKEKLSDNDVVSFLPMEDLGVIDRTIIPKKEKPLKDVVGNYTYFANNDVLLAKITPCFENGKIGVARNLKNGIGFGSSEYIVFRNKGKVAEDYLFYFLSRETFREEGRKKMTGAVGHKRVSKEFIENYEIPLPPLPEQQRIVSILDKCFAAIDKAKANTEKNLQNVKELWESYLQGVFEKKGEGWVDKTLGEVCEVIGGGTPSKKNNHFYEGNIYWATVRDMKSEIISDTEFKINEEAVKKSSTNVIPKNNVIIATRVGLGKICKIANDTAINQDLRGIIPKRVNQMNVDFLYYWLKSISKKIVEEGKGATVQGVTLPFVKGLVIPLAPITEQLTIVRQLDAVRAETQKLEAVYQNKIMDIEVLKKSILQKAFAGELTENNVEAAV